MILRYYIENQHIILISHYRLISSKHLYPNLTRAKIERPLDFFAYFHFIFKKRKSESVTSTFCYYQDVQFQILHPTLKSEVSPWTILFDIGIFRYHVDNQCFIG